MLSVPQNNVMDLNNVIDMQKFAHKEECMSIDMHDSELDM